ncbi:MAG TPA: dihydrodipicolinate synthase family protein [Sedimentisphaerales bacterium]|nr:dihydrodipicolinate synthase family protein [Sedimentisphaerales bacterium]
MADSQIIEKLRSGCVIPAHPLALRPDRSIDQRRQRALTRYYLAAGAGGLAVGVHTTQFAIHNPKIGLYRPVLELAIQTARESAAPQGPGQPVMIAGIVGQTNQAVKEAQLARELGYHVGLLSLTALRGRSIDELIDHARQVARIIPIMGFYLQQAISEMVLPLEFWQRFAEIPNLVAIKIAPFNRYQTLDVLEAVARCGRSDQIALYTGNDDNIILDLLTPYQFNVNGRTVSLRIVGGLLGQWACWTKKAVEHLDRIKTIRQKTALIPTNLLALAAESILARIKRIRLPAAPIPPKLLTLAAQMTLANKAIFDADNRFAGCIPGISYVLKQQGLLEQIGTLDPNEQLSPGQAEKIDRIIRDYPHLTDDDFVRENLDEWLQ